MGSRLVALRLIEHWTNASPRTEELSGQMGDGCEIRILIKR
jgi:hypothetical protein